MKRALICAAMLASLGSFVCAPAARAQSEVPTTAPTSQPATRPVPKDLSENVLKGLAYLAKSQLENGAWGQGDESRNMGESMSKISATPNVADTCMAAMALYRSGSTPSDGPYKTNIVKAVDFVCDQISHADSKDLYITELRGTRTQTKLGGYVDTFMAAQMLAELKDKMPDNAEKKKASDALAIVIKKIEGNQQDNGQWATAGGWAPALAQAQAAKSLNVAAQNGVAVNETVRARAENYAREGYKNGDKAGSAGVALYAGGGQIAAMQSSANANHQMADRMQAMAASPSTSPVALAEVRAQLKRYDDNDKDLAQAQKDIVAKLDDKQFMAGFGSNGGEEFLSYLNIGESLILKGGDDWKKWDAATTTNLNHIQNADGSWSGDHCITGRTFCTAAAVQVLTIDRSPVPAMKPDAVKK